MKTGKLKNRKLFRVGYHYSDCNSGAMEIIEFGADKETSPLALRIEAARIFRKKYNRISISSREMWIL